MPEDIMKKEAEIIEGKEKESEERLSAFRQ